MSRAASPQHVIDASLRALWDAYFQHATWNGLMTVVLVMVNVPCAATGAARAAVVARDELSSTTTGGLDPTSRRAVLLAIVVSTMLAVSVLSTVHRAVTIRIARDPAPSVRESLRRVARIIVPVAGLGIVLGAADVLFVGLAGIAAGLARETGFSAVGFGIVVLVYWLGSRPVVGLATAAVTERGEGTLRAIATSVRLLRGYRIEAAGARVLLLVIALGGLALFLGVPLFGLIGMERRNIGSETVYVGTLLYLLALPWLAMHLASLDAIVEAKLYEAAADGFDASSVARTFE